MSDDSDEASDSNDQVNDDSQPVAWIVPMPQYDADTDDELANVAAPSGQIIMDDMSELDEFRCVLCKTLPLTILYRCQRGHVLCAGCHQMRVLDKMLGWQLGTCPTCSVRIFRHGPWCNVSGEVKLAALCVVCEECGEEVCRSQLRNHLNDECKQRLKTCKYKRIGCDWKGVVGAATVAHEENCKYKKLKGHELLEVMKKMQQQRDAKVILISKIMKLLQLPFLTVRLIQKLPEDTEWRIHFIRFEAFSQHWSVMLKWQVTPLPGESVAELRSSLEFQLCLESPDSCENALGLTYTLVTGTHSAVRFQPNLCEKFDYKRTNIQGPVAILYENTYKNCKTLFTKHGIFGRLIMARI